MLELAIKINYVTYVTLVKQMLLLLIVSDSIIITIINSSEIIITIINDKTITPTGSTTGKIIQTIYKKY